MTTRPRFAAAINCMDGRTIVPASNWIKHRFGVDYVDMITEPGMIGKFAAGEPRLVSSVRRMLEISTGAHASRMVVFVAHYDCVGNPVPREKQLEQLRQSIAILKLWEIEGIEKIVGIWLNERFEVELIEEHETVKLRRGKN